MSEEEIEAEHARIWHSMMGVAGPEFGYEIGRDAATIRRDGRQRGFSEAAMETLVTHIAAFIGTRVNRYEMARGEMPQHLVVRLRVALDDQATDFNDDLQEQIQTIRIPAKESDAASQDDS